jgi:hypothetical protein
MAEDSRTSSLLEMPGWTRIALPSVGDLILVAILCLLVFTSLSVRLLGDAGIGWHIRAGQLILATHHVPHVDPFSSTMAAHPWFAWEWLYDVIVGQLEIGLGLNGVVWFNAAVIALVFGWTIHLLIRQGVDVPIAFALVLLALLASMIHFLARPHVVSWLFTVAWFAILDKAERSSVCNGRRARSQIWLLPLLMLVWVNLHAGFLLGFVLLGIFWLGAMWEWWRTSNQRIEDTLARIAALRRARDLAWVGFLSALASLVNPYGWRLYPHIVSYLSNHFLMNHIEEFRSPNFHSLPQRCFVVLLLVAIAVVARQGRKLRVSGMLVILFAAYAGMYASRNLPVSSLLLVLVVGPLIGPRTSTKGFLHRVQDVHSHLRGHAWPVAALVLTFAIAANGGRVGSTALMRAHFDPQRMPVKAADYLRSHPPGGPVLSPDSWGGYLIYRLYPEQRVVVDDRHDLYGAAFFKSYLKMVEIRPGWEDFLDDHQVCCVLFPRQSALTNVLLQTSNWRPIYQDELAILFVRGRP